MPKLNLSLDPDQIEIGTLVYLEEMLDREQSSIKMREVRDLLTIFVVDDDGAALSNEEATAIINKLTLSEAMQALQAVGDASSTMKAAALPPGQSGSLP